MRAEVYEQIYKVVRAIPRGKVMSYGAVAAAAGFPRAARVVGRALHNNPEPMSIPCHRVVFKNGDLSPAFAFGGRIAQRELLEQEGVEFVGEKVNMSKSLYK